MWNWFHKIACKRKTKMWPRGHKISKILNLRISKMFHQWNTSEENRAPVHDFENMTLMSHSIKTVHQWMLLNLENVYSSKQKAENVFLFFSAAVLRKCILENTKQEADLWKCELEFTKRFDVETKSQHELAKCEDVFTKSGNQIFSFKAKSEQLIPCFNFVTKSHSAYILLAVPSGCREVYFAF